MLHLFSLPQRFIWLIQQPFQAYRASCVALQYVMAFCLIFGVITNVEGMETQRRSVFQRFINDN